jgi:hypothetical protein
VRTLHWISRELNVSETEVTVLEDGMGVESQRMRLIWSGLPSNSSLVRDPKLVVGISPRIDVSLVPW